MRLNGSMEVFFLFLLVLILHGGAHSHVVPGQRGNHDHGHGGAALAGGDHFHGISRTLKQSAPSPAPGQMAPGPEEMEPEENVAPAPALPPSAESELGSGFESGSGQCSTPIMKTSLSLATSVFLEFIQGALPDDSPLKGMDTATLAAWRSILLNSSVATQLWGEAIPLAKEYFNMTLPASPTDLKLSHLATLRGNRRVLLQTSGPLFTIPVYFVVISPAVGPQVVKASNIKKQMEKLNADFAKARIAWELKGSQFLRGDRWFREPVNSQYDMQQKNLYRKGGPEALNVFVRDAPDSGGFILLGQAYFPQNLCRAGNMDLSLLKQDSITLGYSTLPGKSSEYNGATLTHEAGHWLGVAHTFNHPPAGRSNTCDDVYGDMMSDTPVERVANYLCNLNADSCPSLPGKDPVTNYMDYSPDSCMSEFTTQQIVRMQWCYSNIRVYKKCSLPANMLLGPSARKGGPTGGTQRTQASIFRSLLLVLIASLPLLLL